MNDFISTRFAALRTQHLRLLRHWTGSPLQQAWRAWLEELHGLLPAALRVRLAARRVARVTWPLPHAFAVPLPQVLVLDTRQVLIQRLNLPLAATRDLPRMLGYEIDKYTPFPRDEVAFAARVEKTVAGRAHVLLVSIARTRLDEILDACRATGLVLAGIDALGRDGQALGVDLLPDELRPRRGGQSRLDGYLAWFCLVLLLALMVMAVSAREAMVQTMRTEVAAQREQVRQLQTLRQELSNTQGAAGYLMRLKAARPGVSALLTELTSCVGNDTWIEQLEVGDGAAKGEGSELSFSGQSRHASALIGLMKNCPSLDSVQFQGVIQPDPQTGKDRFSVRARLKEDAHHAPTIDPS
ncbi:general secretion pathway protein GspL [Pseudomonas sp. v388]|uniref:PilN domain-containing protein n=1 Tax=Pseudomonas sp. v388 TaxID=2479849 RepID=UPI000F77110A|nr:PilN domain-containing protein [Pseudomonas sp. v388]RRV10683.1 general secretion pathway protein GspL [Pseudomonas sp. v388]